MCVASWVFSMFFEGIDFLVDVSFVMSKWCLVVETRHVLGSFRVSFLQLAFIFLLLSDSWVMLCSMWLYVLLRNTYREKKGKQITLHNQLSYNFTCSKICFLWLDIGDCRLRGLSWHGLSLSTLNFEPVVSARFGGSICVCLVGGFNPFEKY